MKFFEFIVIPSVNYGAFLDPETEEDKYKEIDVELIKFAQDLFYNLTDNDNMVRFLTVPHNAEGLQLLLPGCFFKQMQLVKSCPDNVD